MPIRKAAGGMALALLLVLGCGNAPSDEASIGTLADNGPVRVLSREHVDVEIEPRGPIKLGKNTIEVRFPGNGRVEVASASALMPAHGHGSPPPEIERVEGEPGAFVIRDLVLYMTGRWELRISLRVDAREDEAIVAVDVP